MSPTPSSLLSKPVPLQRDPSEALPLDGGAGEGFRVQHITPENAGWGYVGFEVYKLEDQQYFVQSLDKREACLVPVSGSMKVSIGEEVFGPVGGRASPFDMMRDPATGESDAQIPYACLYVPAGETFKVEAVGNLELAICFAPAKGDIYPTRLIKQDKIAYSIRGTGSNTRHVFDVLPETEEAESLLVVEVITPGGCWSSYPSHKHDRDNLPHESYLEETYYHRLNPDQGFSFQRVYTDDRSLDESMAAYDGDVVKVPKGYHPCSAAHGYDLYYLNVMAGPKRVWKVYDEPDHAWLLPKKS